MQHIFPDIAPNRYAGGSEIDWPEEVLKGLKALNQAASEAENKRDEYLMAKAREYGLAAEKLEDLRSERGLTFSEVEHRDYMSLHQARENTDPTDRKARYNQEWAYYCGFEDLSGGMTLCCGWVRGYPRSESYDDIGCLSGSAGMRYYCQICGHLVGERQNVVS